MKNGTEQKSCLNFFIVSDKIEPLVSSMNMYENDEVALTRYKGKVIYSDHKMLKLNLNINFNKEEHNDIMEVFMVRNKECQKQFCTFTSKDNRFSQCFLSCEESVNVQFKRWQRIFNKAIHACFRKVRVKEKEASKLDILMNEKKTILRKKTKSEEDLENIEMIDKAISDECEEMENENLMKILGEIKNESGSSNNTNIWKEMKKIFS